MCLILFICCMMFCDAAKILAVLPTPCVSHQKVFQSFAQELAARGHEVTMITPLLNHSTETRNIRQINIYNISYPLWKETVTNIFGKNVYYSIRLKTVLKAQAMIFEKILEHYEFKQIFGGNFDLLILEAWIPCLRTLIHIFKAPVLTLSSLGSFIDEHNLIGSTIQPLLYPLSLQQRIHSQSLMDQLSDLHTAYFLHNLLEDVKNDEGILKSVYFKDISSVSELRNNVDMTIMNVHPMWEQNRPVPLSLVYLGALHLKAAQELPEDLKSYLDISTNGVIYVSFGTNMAVGSLPSASIQTMVRVLSTLPYSELWKWDADHLPGQTDNIRISKWLPQADLLRHTSIKLFITQAGLQSTDEAIAAGVPLLGLPMLGDQWYNAENYVKLRIGLKLDLETLREEEFRSAIQTLIHDDSYRHNVRRFGALVRDAPQSALERAVWWTEHALRHGTAHLRAPARNMRWTDYLEIELMFIVFTFVSIFVLVAMSIVYYASRCMFRMMG